MSWISPELATLYPKPFSDPHFLFEEKFDGIRCIAIKKKGKVTLFSRANKSLTDDFPTIQKALEEEKTEDYILDGEIVAFEGAVTSFAKLQQRKQKKVPVYYYVFDLLKLGNKRVTKLPLVERKKQLQKIGFKNPIYYTPHVLSKGEALFHKAKVKGWEGIIGKRIDAPYLSRRTRDWLKIKCVQRQEFVIGGFTEPKKSRIGFGALLLGYYERGRFRYAGKVGTGYDTALLKSLAKSLRSLLVTKSPFADEVEEPFVHFVKPTLVCEIHFTEWTKEGKLRHPSFLGLRSDKSAKEV